MFQNPQKKRQRRGSFSRRRGFVAALVWALVPERRVPLSPPVSRGTDTHEDSDLSLNFGKKREREDEIVLMVHSEKTAFTTPREPTSPRAYSDEDRARAVFDLLIRCGESESGFFSSFFLLLKTRASLGFQTHLHQKTQGRSCPVPRAVPGLVPGEVPAKGQLAGIDTCVSRPRKKLATLGTSRVARAFTRENGRLSFEHAPWFGIRKN